MRKCSRVEKTLAVRAFEEGYGIAKGTKIFDMIWWRFLDPTVRFDTKSYCWPQKWFGPKVTFGPKSECWPQKQLLTPKVIFWGPQMIFGSKSMEMNGVFRNIRNSHLCGAVRLHKRAHSALCARCAAAQQWHLDPKVIFSRKVSFGPKITVGVKSHFWAQMSLLCSRPAPHTYECLMFLNILYKK